MIVSLLKTVKYIVITPITNINYADKTIEDYSQLLEIEVGTDSLIKVFNAKKEIVENIKPMDIKEHHYYLTKEGVLNKIMHVLD